MISHSITGKDVSSSNAQQLVKPPISRSKSSKEELGVLLPYFEESLTVLQRESFQKKLT